MGSSLLFNPYPVVGHSILYKIKSRICFPSLYQKQTASTIYTQINQPYKKSPEGLLKLHTLSKETN